MIEKKRQGQRTREESSHVSKILRSTPQLVLLPSTAPDAQSILIYIISAFVL